MADDSKIPKGRVRRSAKLGSIVGVQGARYAGTKAANVGRSEEGGKEHLEQRHLETAMKMVGALGQMKGAAMKLGQFASFIDTEFIPEEYREIYQEQLAKLRTDAPAMPWEKVEKVLEEEYDGEPLSELFAEFETEAFAAASIGQVHRARAARRPPGRGQDPVPGDRRGARGRPPQRRHAGAAGAGARPRARRQGDRRGAARAGDGGARLRVRGAEPALLRPRLPRPPLHLRARSGHPALAAADPRHRAGRGASDFEEIKQLPHEERSRFGEIVFRGSFGSIYHLQHFNADPHPGNYILMEDGRVAFLDFGMTKKLDREQILLEQRAFDAASRDDPEAFRQALHDLGFVKKPSKLDAERLLEHMGAVGGWYVEDREIEITAAAGDEDHRVDQRPALGVLRPDAPRVDPGRRADGPADGDRRRRRARPAAGEAQLAPDRPRVGLRRPAGDRARPAGVGVLRGTRGQADARTGETA